jgi:hypothetical protein
MYIVMYLENKNKSILLAIGELRVYMDLRVYDKTLKIRVRFVCKTCTSTVSAGTGTVSLGPTHSVPVQNPNRDRWSSYTQSWSSPVPVKFRF